MGKTRRNVVVERDKVGRGGRVKDKHKKKGSHGYVSEQEFELYLLRTHGLKIHLMRGDGNCLFRSIAHQLQRDPDQDHYKVRSRIVEYMEQRKDFYSLFIEDDVTWDDYVDSMKAAGTWGGYQELCAASSAFNLAIHVYQWNEPKYVIQPADLYTHETVETSPRRVIMLSFHDGCHYNSLRPADISALGGSISDSTSAMKSLVLPPKKEHREKSSPYQNREVLVHSISMAVNWVTREEIIASLEWAENDEDEAIELLCSHLHGLRTMMATTEILSKSACVHQKSSPESVVLSENISDCPATDAHVSYSITTHQERTIQRDVSPTITSPLDSEPLSNLNNSIADIKTPTSTSGRVLSKKELRQKERQEKLNAQKRPISIGKSTKATIQKINSTKPKHNTSVSTDYAKTEIESKIVDQMVDSMREIVI